MSIYASTEERQWRLNLINNPPRVSKMFSAEEWEHMVMNEFIFKISGMTGLKHTEETKSRWKGRKTRLGAKLTEETKRKIGSANSRKHTDEHKRKVSESLIGNQRRLGILHDEDTKLKIRNSMKLLGAPHLSDRPRASCVHCGKTMDISNLAKYHNDKCKMKDVNNAEV
jgi:hypothetical protein